MWHKALTAIVLVLTVLASSAHAHQLGFDNAEDRATFLEQRQNETLWIRIKSEGSTTQCTGVYLGDRWMLTAGHCVINEQTGETLDDAQITVADRATWREGERATAYADIEKAVYGEWNGSFTDLALLRVGYRPVEATAVDVSCQLPQLGQTVVVVGMPTEHQWLVTLGTVATLERNLLESSSESQTRVLFTAPGLASGASGGPVFNRDGKLIGIYSQSKAETKKNPNTGQQNVISLQLGQAMSGPTICQFFE